MLVSHDALRERFERLSSRELLRIIGSHQYTLDARDIALAVLKTRPLDEVESDPEQMPSPTEKRIGLAIITALVANSALVAGVVVRAWREVDERPGLINRLYTTSPPIHGLT